MKSSFTQDSIPNTAEGSDVSKTDLVKTSLSDDDEPFTSTGDICLTVPEVVAKIPDECDKENKLWVPRDKKLKHWVDVEFEPSQTSFLDVVKPQPHTPKGKTLWCEVRESLPKAEALNAIATKIIAEHKVIPKQPKKSLLFNCNFLESDCHIPIHNSGDQA
jgi:hypothetical protein